MKLVRLEVRNYRSIEKQTQPDNAIKFGSLNCFVGKNNAGKSNILEAIRFLLGDESLSEDMFRDHDPSNEIDVRGYFEIEDVDFGRLKLEAKIDNMKRAVLGDGTIGICRRSNSDDLEVMGYYPSAERLKKETFSRFHEEAWARNDSKTGFRDCMLDKYPELEKHLVEGKEKNKGEWENAYARFVQEKPSNIDFELVPAAPATGISADLNNILPRTVMVPAVKEISDATKTSKRGDLGRLIHELASEIEDELDNEIEQALSSVYRKLNVVRDEGTGDVEKDSRLSGIKEIEDRISSYLAEAFRGISTSLEFPSPESRDIFKGVQVWIEEEDFSRVKVEEVGEGVKRLLIFSLFRTLADLRTGSLFGDAEENEPDRRPLLILYEEAELFLHPNLQGVLVEVLERLKGAGDQVVFTTHSPFMIDGEALDRINIVRKFQEGGTTVQSYDYVLEKRDVGQVNRLTQIQNISSYIFADRIVLVEGESDRIVIKKLAKRLKKEWNFKRQGIPILPVNGKGNLPLFADFLSALNIRPFVVTDLDAVEHVIGELVEGHDVRQHRQELLRMVERLIESGEVSADINAGFINATVSGYKWNAVWGELEGMLEDLAAGEQPSDPQIGALEKLLRKATRKDARKKALASSEHPVEEARTELVKGLLTEDILMLCPSLEHCYPRNGGGKIEAAVDFEPGKYSEQQLRSYFLDLENEQTDVERFLGMVFDDG